MDKKIESEISLVKISFDPSHLFVYLLFIPLLLAYHAVTWFSLPEMVRAIFYFLPVYGLVVLFFYHFFAFDRKIKVEPSYLYISFVYVLLVLIGNYLTYGELYISTFYRDIVIATLPLIFFTFDWKFTERQFNWIFLAAFLSFAIWHRFELSLNFLNTILVTSESDVEYHFGCVAGIFVIYYLYKRKWLWLAFSIFFLSMVSKRASLLGLFAAIPVYYLLNNVLKILDRKVWLFIFLIVYYLIFWLIGTNMEFFGKFFLELIGYGHMDLDYFLTGRMILTNQIQPEILDRGPFTFFFGNGPGQAEVFIWKTMKYPNVYLWDEKPYLLHNDFLKLQFEIGILGVVLYFFIFYYLMACSPLGVFIFLYSIPLFLIDNTIIYMYNILVACIAARVFHEPTKNGNKLFRPLV